ncbi:hypothetical protein RND81_04G123100 [Saponaria officinalis]|uniref:RING-type domain-containing protein n=1 Tax=Saponaria officinalis TaxID=3572 RepID=A0AAW1LK79_SAPOF
MGGNNSKDSFRSNSSSWNQPPQQPPAYSTPYYVPDNHQYYAAAAPSPPPPTEAASGYGGYADDRKKKFQRRYSMIANEFASLDEVTQALARAGLESSNLIVGIDFTKSNEWTGAKSFNKKSLHHIGNTLNPYEQAISIIGKTLAAFDDDNLIPCYGFGDATTHDQYVFSFYPEERVCNGFEEVLSRYREIVPHLRLAGPTSFAPVIEKAMTIVEQSGGQYHVLLIIADGQVTRSVDTEHGRLSPQEQKTVDAIVAASKYPLSIVLVGVGDGPWDMMEEFDDNIPARDFDNFQFVNFTEIMAKNTHQTRKETEFALSALMEIPSQYKATIELGLLGRRRGTCPEIVALPPPVYAQRVSTNASSFSHSNPSHSTDFQSSTASFYDKTNHVGTAPPAPSFAYDTGFQPSPTSFYDSKSHAGTAPPEPSFGYDTGPHAASSAFDDQLCPICFTNMKDMAFGCGHQTCAECGQDLQNCPICRSDINTRIKLY